MVYSKNSEGYSDPTAATALSRVAHDEKMVAKYHPLVYVASAYRGNVELNTESAKRYSRFVLAQGKIPFTPHLLYTQFLDDNNADERKKGLLCGTVMLGKCDALWAFGDISNGMLAELEKAKRLGLPVRYFNTKCEEVF